jgi:hypothetical protein
MRSAVRASHALGADADASLVHGESRSRHAAGRLGVCGRAAVRCRTLDMTSDWLEDVIRGSEPFTTVLRAVLERCGAFVIGTTPTVRFSGRTYSKSPCNVRVSVGAVGR